jgi:hypothetical protein
MSPFGVPVASFYLRWTRRGVPRLYGQAAPETRGLAGRCGNQGRPCHGPRQLSRRGATWRATGGGNDHVLTIKLRILFWLGQSSC